MFDMATNLVFLGAFLLLFSRARERCWGWVSAGLLIMALYNIATIFWENIWLSFNPRLIQLAIAASTLTGAFQLLKSIRRKDSYMEFLKMQEREKEQGIGVGLVALSVVILTCLVIGFIFDLPTQAIFIMIYAGFLPTLPIFLPHYKEYEEWRESLKAGHESS